MYSQSKGNEPSFGMLMLANRRQGGIERFNRACGSPKFEYVDPLDEAFPENPPKRKRRKKDMTGLEFRDARGQLGHNWGLGRPLTLTEFGRVLRLGGVRPDQSVRDYERGKTQVSGPLSLLIELLLAGAKPKNLALILWPNGTQPTRPTKSVPRSEKIL